MIYAWMLFEWNAERLDLLKYTVWTLKNAKWKSVFNILLGREALVQKLSRIFGQCPNYFWTPTFDSHTKEQLDINCSIPSLIFNEVRMKGRDTINVTGLQGRPFLGKGSTEKKTFSFGHCPNPLTPPPHDPNSGNLVLFFRKSKFKIWKSV